MNRGQEAARQRGQITDEEVAWLRSFGWNNERIAARLGITVASMEHRDWRNRKRLRVDL